MKVAQRKGWPEVTPVPFLKPDPIAYLMGCSNEALVIVDGQEMTTLIDVGAQVSSIRYHFCKDLALQIQPLGWLLDIEGTGGSITLYLGFMEVNLQIPGIKSYNEDVLLLVIPTTTYSEMVPVRVGSKITDRAMSIITKGELTKVTMTWKQAQFGAVMSGSLLLPHTSSNTTGVGKEVIHSSPKGDPMEVREFCLDDVRGPVHITWTVTIPPFSTLIMHTNTSVKGHGMWVHVFKEPTPCLQLPIAVVPMATYRELHLGSLRVPICLHNLGSHSIEIPTKTVVGPVAPANHVPQVVLQTRTSEESNNKPPKGWILEALDLQGLRK